jgi:hypothetical protein
MDLILVISVALMGSEPFWEKESCTNRCNEKMISNFFIGRFLANENTLFLPQIPLIITQITQQVKTVNPVIPSV